MAHPIPPHVVAVASEARLNVLSTFFKSSPDLASVSTHSLVRNWPALLCDSRTDLLIVEASLLKAVPHWETLFAGRALLLLSEDPEIDRVECHLNGTSPEILVIRPEGLRYVLSYALTNLCQPHSSDEHDVQSCGEHAEPAEERSFAGIRVTAGFYDLSQVPVRAVTAMMIHEMQTGILYFENGDRQGEIHYLEGRLQWALEGKMEGLPALVRLILWKSGHARWVHKNPPISGIIDREVVRCLLGLPSYTRRVPPITYRRPYPRKTEYGHRPSIANAEWKAVERSCAQPEKLLFVTADGVRRLFHEAERKISPLPE